MSQVVDEKEDIDSYVAQIVHSSLYTIVIEGKDDRLVYNEFEKIYDDLNCFVDVLPVGGRNTALGIFDKLKNTPHIERTIFIVDQDEWIIKGKNPAYIHDRIICTHGYSFENDIFIDGNLENDMQTKNPTVFNDELPIVLKWYALEMSRILSSRPTANLNMHIENLFNQASIYTVPQSGEIFPTPLFSRLQSEYHHLLRGKTLLQFYLRVMNSRPDYNRGHTVISTIENVCKHKGNCLNRIFQEVDNLIKLSY
ncbi:DUF4435 domain-containing protein [Acinetobacter nosocomialis]|uniref:DUF4435 domain-containing protein n=1 Tax=Acinetobacter nosocomialis TaxID=106654 RepID=UPI000DE758C5|nr:DUF4435 domain-containing protein [Acinetobacter nosocomialis]SSV47910.1 Uncharacterised protein [Acinetobacter nosocomialis]